MKHLVKSSEDIEILKECGKRLASVRNALAASIKPGVSTQDIEDLANKLIAEKGDTASFKNYTPQGANRPFPAAVCVSVNDEIVHGIPNEDPKILAEGDIVGIDLGVTHKGLITDSAVTVPVGKISEEIQELLAVTKKALAVGIREVRAGNKTGDIGAAIEEFVAGRFGIVEELGGHGVGWHVHEEPTIPNFGTRGTGTELLSGMVIAIEPMLNLGSKDIILADDGYTFKTKDGKQSAHFEHTVLVTEGDPEILTQSS